MGTTKVHGSPGSDEIVDASLLRPRGEEHRTSPTPEGKAALLGEVRLPQVP